MSVISAVLMTKLADFGVKVLIKLGWKLHDGYCHDSAEVKRRRIKEREAKNARVD